MSDVEEYFTQMAGTDADKPDATDDAKHDETMGSGQVTDVAGGLERPSFWTDDMEREFRAEVKSLFDDMVGRQQGELSVRDQCEHVYEELTATVNGKYKELTGKDLPASMARNLDQLLTQITMAPLNEPEHGPGLWAKLPQHSIVTMVEARPLDLTGSPTRMDIDLMMLHTIRMGRFLTTHYTDWAQTLPPCWIRHDDVVQEVYALKCYMDLVVASPNGGLYAPTLQSLIHSTLERVKAYLASSEASNSDHRHHLSGPEERQREQARKDEYEHWFNRDGGWSEEPGFDQSWRFSTPSEGLDTVCDLMTPTRVDDVAAADDVTLRNQAAQWRSEIDSLRGSYDTDHATEHLAQAAQDEETIRRVWLSYTGRERESRDRLDRAATSAAMLMRDTERSRLLSGKDRRNLNDLIGRARMILHAYGKTYLDENYKPCSIGLQDDLTARLERIVQGDPAGVFDRCERMIDQMDATFARGKEPTDDQRTA